MERSPTRSLQHHPLFPEIYTLRECAAKSSNHHQIEKVRQGTATYMNTRTTRSNMIFYILLYNSYRYVIFEQCECQCEPGWSGANLKTFQSMNAKAAEHSFTHYQDWMYFFCVVSARGHVVLFVLEKLWYLLQTLILRKNRDNASAYTIQDNRQQNLL